MSNSAIKNRQGVEILVRGTVQGVGFRPFVYTLATRLAITGSVKNNGEGVEIVAFAEDEALKAFVYALQNEAPPLARIDSIECCHDGLKAPLAGSAPDSFVIDSSITGSAASAGIPPDISICDDCKEEIVNPADRRYRYPFTNCTNCGPRFTIIEAIPYDRPATSMARFTMCPSCNAEYHDPLNRRFHAQPNACPDCGPSLSFGDGKTATSSKSPLAKTAQALLDGEIVAIRGLGGFHLAVDATNHEAVARLRSRKGRPDKPLAVMVADLEMARQLCSLDPVEEEALVSMERPIVVATKKESSLADNIAPNIGELGIFLPYTPLHYLLFEELGRSAALVMTSGNASGLPLSIANDEALLKLGMIADKFLLHNREIVTRADDSVVKFCAGQRIILRRSRGFVPRDFKIEEDLPEILGCGAGLKNTFALGRGNSIVCSQHIGDLDNLETLGFFEESLLHFKSFYQLTPKAVACDLHPDYQASRFAKKQGLPLYPVQHHHAHAVAVMAEHSLRRPVLAIVLDGTGLGDDGTIWGGEILLTGLTSYQRLGHLLELHLPGGDAAVTAPWRMALALLFAMGGSEALQKKRLPATLRFLSDSSLTALGAMLENGFNSPLTSSCGRLFDGVASLLGIRQEISFEGQAAMELETAAARARDANWHKALEAAMDNPLPGLVKTKKKIGQLNSVALIEHLLIGISQGEPIESLALRFHTMLIGGLSALVQGYGREYGIEETVLCGGCMQNGLLLEGFFHTMEAAGLRPYTGNSLPINDGGISVGQTIVGGLRHVSGHPDESNRHLR